jgi:hypothetical protein
MSEISHASLMSEISHASSSHPATLESLNEVKEKGHKEELDLLEVERDFGM